MRLSALALLPMSWSQNAPENATLFQAIQHEMPRSASVGIPSSSRARIPFAAVAAPSPTAMHSPSLPCPISGAYGNARGRGAIVKI